MNNYMKNWPIQSLSLLVAAFCGGMTATWFVASPQPVRADSPENVAKEVRAQRFVVVDSEGRERIGLSCVQGSPGIAVYDDKGKKRAILTLLSDGSCQFVLEDEAGRPRAQMVANASGDAGFNLYDDKMKARMHMEVGKDGVPVFALEDDKGRVRLGMSADPNGETELKLYDATEQARFAATLPKEGWPVLQLNAEKCGTVSLIAAKAWTGLMTTLSQHKGSVFVGIAEPDQLPGMVVMDQKGNHRVRVGVHTDGRPVIANIDADGKVVWAAPPEKR